MPSGVFARMGRIAEKEAFHHTAVISICDHFRERKVHTLRALTRIVHVLVAIAVAVTNAAEAKATATRTTATSAASKCVVRVTSLWAKTPN